MHICILIIYFINSDHKSNLIVIISFLLCNLEEFGLVIPSLSGASFGSRLASSGNNALIIFMLKLGSKKE